MYSRIIVLPSHKSHITSQKSDLNIYLSSQTYQGLIPTDFFAQLYTLSIISDNKLNP